MLYPQPVPLGRFELKFTVPDHVARDMEAYAAPWTKPDKHVVPGSTGYTITSLYFDTPDMRFLWEKRTLQPNRMKVRIRTYGPNADGPLFAEIKRRFGDLMVKTRAIMPWEALPWVGGLVGGDKDPGVYALKPAGVPVMRDFVAQMRGLALRPVVVVRYDRVALAGIYEDHTRLTFDRSLRCRTPNGLDLAGGDRGYRAVDYAALFDRPESQVIVELKFDGRAPVWMRDLIYRYDLLRSAFSKYVAGLDVLGDEDRIDAPGRLVPIGRWWKGRTWTS